MSEPVRKMRDDTRATPILWVHGVFLVVLFLGALILELNFGLSGRGIGLPTLAWVVGVIGVYYVLIRLFATSAPGLSARESAAPKPRERIPLPTEPSSEPTASAPLPSDLAEAGPAATLDANSRADRFQLQAPDLVVAGAAAIGCVVWVLVWNAPGFNLIPPLCLVYGLPAYLGARDKFVNSPRKGPRRSPLEQLQEWDDERRY